MSPTRPAVTLAFTVVLSAGCGASSTPSSEGGDGAKAGAGTGGSAGTRESGGTGATAGRGGNASGTGGTLSGGGGSVAGRAGTGSAGSGGDAASGGTATGAGNGGSRAGNASGGTSGEAGSGDGGNAGERAIECTGAMQYFPEFERSCAAADDCVAVAHQTSCCGAQLVMGIRASEQAAFDAAEATCDQQYPACGCAAFGVDIEDGTRVDFAWQAQVEVACDGGICKAHYAGTSFACGTSRCTEEQYCVESSGGPAGTPTSYACNPTACTDCSCLTMSGCTCSDTLGHLKMTCQYP